MRAAPRTALMRVSVDEKETKKSKIVFGLILKVFFLLIYFSVSGQNYLKKIKILSKLTFFYLKQLRSTIVGECLKS